VFVALSPVLGGWVAETTSTRTGFQYLDVATQFASAFVALLFSDRVYLGGDAAAASGDD
jgi:hypothetical protein